MAKGKVEFFDDEKGYGFIETEDADEDVFFHMEDAGRLDLEEGQEVEFEIERGSMGGGSGGGGGGLRATNVVASGSLPEPSLDDVSVTSSKVEEFLKTHAPTGDEAVHIGVTSSELDGQFKRMSDELDIPESEVGVLRNLIDDIIESRLESEQMTMDSEMKEATANVIAATLIQEYNQTGGES